MIEIAPDVVVNLYLLTSVAVGIGLISGFAGVSGGYLLTPVLIVLGLPAPLAVGTALALMTANVLLASVRHKKLGHLDLKMGLILAGGTVAGTEVGVRLLQTLETTGGRFAELAVLGTLVVTLAAIGTSMIREVRDSTERLRRGLANGSVDDEGEVRTAACQFLQSIPVFPHMRFTKSKLRISGWIVFALGALIGILSGFLGIGGCFVRSPALIYLIGQTSMMAIGTNLLGSFFGLAYGCFRHAMLGNVELGIALTMLLGTSIGTFIGAQGTAYLKGLAVRYVLVGSVIAGCLGPALKMVYFITGLSAWDTAARIVTVAQIIVPVTMVIVLLILVARHLRGLKVPTWAQRLMVNPCQVAPGRH